MTSVGLKFNQKPQTLGYKSSNAISMSLGKKHSPSPISNILQPHPQNNLGDLTGIRSNEYQNQSIFIPTGLQKHRHK